MALEHSLHRLVDNEFLMGADDDALDGAANQLALVNSLLQEALESHDVKSSVRLISSEIGQAIDSIADETRARNGDDEA